MSLEGKNNSSAVATHNPSNLTHQDHLQKSWSDPKDSGGQGFKDSSEMLKNYKDLKVWQKSYGLCEVERMLKALIKSLEKKHLAP
jgi:hypothetical protein